MIEKKRPREYDTFCGTLCNLFDKDWAKVGDKVETGWGFLSHIPDSGWNPMTKIAVDTWDSWPRNWVKAVSEIYGLWKSQERIERSVTDCEHCNGNGFFSGIKAAEIRTGIFVKYRYTFRCGACRNWFGTLGEKIPAALPIEVKANGFEIDIYSKPMPTEERQHSLKEILESVTHRVNPKTKRPDIQPVRESFDDREIPF
jgi:hypothetical protein